MMLEESVKVLTMQEEILQFSHFTNEDAWELGSYMVEEAARNDLPVAVSIRLNNGYISDFSMDSVGPTAVMNCG